MTSVPLPWGISAPLLNATGAILRGPGAPPRSPTELHRFIHAALRAGGGWVKTLTAPLVEPEAVSLWTGPADITRAVLGRDHAVTVSAPARRTAITVFATGNSGFLRVLGLRLVEDGERDPAGPIAWAVHMASARSWRRTWDLRRGGLYQIQVARKAGVLSAQMLQIGGDGVGAILNAGSGFGSTKEAFAAMASTLPSLPGAAHHTFDLRLG